MRHKKQTLREKRDAIKRVMISTSFRAGLLVTAIALLVLDVVQVSAVSTKGYDISDYKRDIRQLEQENEKLDVSIARYRSMQSIQERMQALELEDVGTPQFVQVNDSSVAIR